MRVTVFIAIFFLFIICIITASFAAPTAEIVRDSSIGVESDTFASIQMTPSDTYGFVKLDTNGNITASPSNLQASDLNSNMVLTVGDIDSPSSNEAFTIKNTRTEALVYTLRLAPS